MKKNITLVLLLFFCLMIQSQAKKIKRENTYIKISLYKEHFKRKLSKSDSLNFKFVNGDTLVLVKNIKKLNRKSARSHQINKRATSRSYMLLADYKKRYSKNITKEDSLNFKFNKNDTLVLISNKDFYKNKKRVSVPYEVKDDKFLAVYKAVVFARGNTKSKHLRMRLWKDEIKIFFDKQLDKKIKKELKNFAKNLDKQVDSLKISFVKKKKHANYIIYQTDTENSFKYEPRIKSGVTEYYLYWNNRQQIYDCKLQVDTRSFKKYKNVILSAKINLFQSLGYFQTTKNLPKEDFLSSRLSKDKKVSSLDIEILKYHYSYGICKFTDLKAFEEGHQKAKEVLKKGGVMRFVHTY